MALLTASKTSYTAIWLSVTYDQRQQWEKDDANQNVFISIDITLQHYITLNLFLKCKRPFVYRDPIIKKNSLIVLLACKLTQQVLKMTTCAFLDGPAFSSELL